MMANKKVYVAGASGFIGGQLAKRLAANGVHVRAGYHTREVAPAPVCEPLQGDLRKAEDCARAVEGVDKVFMCAANTQGAAVITQTPLAHVTPNILMNTQMLEASHRAGVKKFVFVSSGAAYPDTGSHPAKEEDMFSAEPMDVYYAAAWMKRYSEVLCRTYAEKIASPMSCVVVRPSNVYGPGDKFDPKTSHVTASLVRRVAEREDPMAIWGTGNDIRDLIYIDDFIDGMLMAAETDDDFLTVNICAGTGVSVRDILFEAMRIDGFTDAVVTFDDTKPSTAPIKLFDGGFARTHLGFEPKVGLSEGLRRTLAWYRQCLRKSAPDRA